MDQVVHVLERLRIGRCVAMVDDDEYKELMARKTELPKTRFGDCYDPEHVESISRLTQRV